MIPITYHSYSAINQIMHKLLKIGARIFVKILNNNNNNKRLPIWKDSQEKISSKENKYHKFRTHKESKDRIVLDNYLRMWYLGGIDRRR